MRIIGRGDTYVGQWRDCTKTARLGGRDVKRERIPRGIILKRRAVLEADLSLGGVGNFRSSHDFRYYLMGRGSLGMAGMGWDDVETVVVVVVVAKLEGEIALRCVCI